MNDVKMKRSPLAGAIMIFAVGLEVVALLWGGLLPALFGLIGFVLGVLYIVVGVLHDPDSMITTLNKFKRENAADDSPSVET